MEPISKADFDVDNFMRISASLVRKLGSANDALVLARIVFRCALATSLTHEHDGHIWWATTKDDLADETGLTPAQVKHSLGRLVDAGLIVAEEHRLGGATDRTKSYRAAVPPEASSHDAKSHPSPFERTPVAALTFYQEDKKKGYTGEAESKRIDAAFERAWSAWPKKVERKDAERRFKEAAKKVPLDELVEFIRTHGAAYAAYREKVYTPGLATWLHKERWTDELVGPEPGRPGATRPVTRPGHLDRAREIIERGRALDGAQGAVDERTLELEELNP